MTKNREDKKGTTKKFVVSKKGQKILRQAIYHPHPDVQRKCLAVLLLSFLFSAALVALILGITAQSVRNYWNAYKKGGIEALQKNNHKGKRSALSDYEDSIEKEFIKDPPATIKEAASRIEKMTGVRRSLKAVRHFLKTTLKLSYRKVGSIPAKADHEKQEKFLDEKLKPLLESAKKGLCTVLFVDAAHFVHAPFLGYLWTSIRKFVKAPSGRKRFNVLGAVNAISKQLHFICNDSYVNAQTVCDHVQKIADFYIGQPIYLIMDNARYQKCELVALMAKKLSIEIVFLPPYSPNLNIIERLWKFVKKKSLNSKYYEKFSEFQESILDALKKSNEEWQEELSSLLSLNFQMFPIENDDKVA